jgi:hypothetical protein
VAEAEQLPLASVEILHGGALELQLREQLLLPGFAQRLNQFGIQIEVVLERRLPRSGHEQDAAHTHPRQFLHHVLDHRFAADRQHFLRLRFGGRQQPGTEAGDGDDGDIDIHHCGFRIADCGLNCSIHSAIRNPR